MSPSLATLPELKRPARTAFPATALIAAALFLFFAVLFIALRSNQFTAVDGALRCLEVYHHPHLFFHGNNHLLYPVNIFAWSRLWGFLGFSAATPFAFLRNSQCMNAICAAATIALLWLLIRGIGADACLTSLLVVVYAFSRAVLLHATNSAEPVVGLMCAIASLFFIQLGARRSNFALAAVSGLFAALALATYQAMFLVFAACLWLCFFPQRVSVTTRRRAIRMAAVFLLSAGLIASGIYACAYAFEGVPFGLPMVRRFFQIGGGVEVYGRFSLSKILNFPLGFLNDLVPAVPDGYGGFRSLVTRNDKLHWFARIAVLAVLVFTPLLLLAVRSVRNWRGWPLPARLAFLAAIAAILPVFWPVIYWDPMYDKLWLLPLAMLVVSIACAARLTPWNSATRRTAIIVLFALAVIEIPTNLYRTIRDHRSQTEGLPAADRIMNLVSRNDGIVVDFDKVSSLYIGFAGTENAIVLPATTSATARPAVDTLAANCRKRHGKLYFLEILDESETAWNSFMGSRVGIPYHSFDHYRADSSVVERFHISTGDLTLRVYNP